jgi:hypothetical protein
MGVNNRYNQGDYAFAVEQWDAADQHIKETLALANHAIVAEAAFNAGVMVRSGATAVSASGRASAGAA